MKEIIFSKVEGFQSATLLNLNSIAVSFKDFYCGFQNTNFPEQVSVAASKKDILHFWIKISISVFTLFRIIFLFVFFKCFYFILHNFLVQLK